MAKIQVRQSVRQKIPEIALFLGTLFLLALVSEFRKNGGNYFNGDLESQSLQMPVEPQENDDYQVDDIEKVLQTYFEARSANVSDQDIASVIFNVSYLPFPLRIFLS